LEFPQQHGRVTKTIKTHNRFQCIFQQEKIIALVPWAGNKVAMWRTADPPTRVQIPPRPLTKKKSGRKETMRRKKYFIEAIIVLCITILLVLPLANKPLKAEPSTSLLINEVMYRPLENENTNEWIELYNPTSTPIDVAGWMIADEKETDTLLGDDVNGDGTTIIPPGGYAIITDKGTTIYDTYTVADSALRLSVDDSTLCGYGLNNQKEKILLLDPMGTCVDAVEWGFDYDDVPGSPAKLVAKGNSLARYGDIDQDDSSLDFIECSTPTPVVRTYGTKSLPMSTLMKISAVILQSFSSLNCITMPTPI
jgi:hypothetical protein